MSYGLKQGITATEAAEALQLMRLDLGYTQEEMAETIRKYVAKKGQHLSKPGYPSYKQYCRWERGEYYLPWHVIDVLIKMAKKR